MYQRILVPVDGSDTASKALAAALQMAREAGGRVRMIHAVDEMAYATGIDSYGGNSGELIRIMRETGSKILDDHDADIVAAVMHQQVGYFGHGDPSVNVSPV